MPIGDRLALDELGLDLGRLGMVRSELDPELAHHFRGRALPM